MTDLLPGMVRRAQQVLGNESDAEDAGQSALRTMLRRWSAGLIDKGRMTSEEDLSKLAMTIVRRRAYLIGRRQGINKKALEKLQMIGFQTADPADELIIEELLERLTSEQRHIVLLVAAGWKQKEIAEKIGRSPPIVRKRLEDVQRIVSRSLDQQKE